MSLRLKINLLVGVLALAFLGWLLAAEVAAMRQSVQEEVVAANRVADQLLRRLVRLQAANGNDAMLDFLQGLGRVRANDIELYDADGRLLYRSPPSTYKAGRDAPDWFERLIRPQPTTQLLALPAGQLIVRSNASRAVLDGWDALVVQAGWGLALLAAMLVAVYALVGRTVRPFAQVVDALGRLERGDFATELPPLPGREAGTIGAAFNRMARALRAHLETERELAATRELSRWVNQRIEAERRQIARELHDEFGQSVTAIRSLALSIVQRTGGHDAVASQAAQAIADEASRQYDAMQGLIPRLAPLVIDRFGLGAALDDLAGRTRRLHPDVSVRLACALEGVALAPETALALYRAAQEGITNALRHGRATRLALDVQVVGDEVHLVLEDDGAGLADDWQSQPGHHGLRWLHERVSDLGGRAALGACGTGGVRLQVAVPVAAPPTGSTDEASDVTDASDAPDASDAFDAPDAPDAFDAPDAREAGRRPAPAGAPGGQPADAAAHGAGSALARPGAAVPGAGAASPPKGEVLP